MNSRVQRMSAAHPNPPDPQCEARATSMNAHVIRRDSDVNISPARYPTMHVSLQKGEN